MLAVANNPDLDARRHRRGEAGAQVYAAGLWPDPALSLDLAHPTTGGARTNGLDSGISYALQRLVTRGTDIAAARARARQVDLELLWQEWQVIQRSRLLRVRVLTTRRRLQLLTAARNRYHRYYDQSRRLLAQGALTLKTAAAVATGWFDLEARVRAERRRLVRQRHALRALLGLAPDAALPLAPLAKTPPPVEIPPATWNQLPRRRPDLRALQAGYQGQELRLHSAILARFPAIELGLTHGRDTDAVYTSGLGLRLDLPLFSGNRGPIARARATRARLRAEYQARLTRTRNDIALLQARDRLLRQQRAVLRRRLPQLEALVEDARQARARGNLPALDLLNLETSLLDRRLEQVDLDQSLRRIHIALDTLLAWPATRTHR